MSLNYLRCEGVVEACSIGELIFKSSYIVIVQFLSHLKKIDFLLGHGPYIKTLPPPPWGFLKTVIFGHLVI